MYNNIHFFSLFENLRHIPLFYYILHLESGENVIDAAKREVEEETGFTNLKYIKTLGGEVRAEYFAAHKDQNRVAFTTAVVFELIDETQKEVSEEEKDAYDIIWLSKEEIVYPKVVHAELNDWLSRFDNDDYIFTGNGILTNSGEFTNLDSESAKIPKKTIERSISYKAKKSKKALFSFS
jgi:hypothetical protein